MSCLVLFKFGSFTNLRYPQSALGYEKYNVTCARVYWTPKRYFQIISVKCFFQCFYLSRYHLLLMTSEITCRSVIIASFYLCYSHSPAVFILSSIYHFVNCICSGLTYYLAGVIAMEWCPSDSSYLLTCAKDNRTICWDTNTGEVGRWN